jgi:hypothetical protein
MFGNNLALRVELPVDELRRVVEEFLQRWSGTSELFIHIGGGQHKSYFTRLSQHGSVDVVFARPVIAALYLIAWIVPCYEGLLQIRRPINVWDDVLEDTELASLVRLYLVPQTRTVTFLAESRQRSKETQLTGLDVMTYYPAGDIAYIERYSAPEAQ